MSKEANFEQSFVRLEAILDQMNSGKATLDESLKLYEEADKLIGACTLRLSEAEAKIETLIKNRKGELTVDEDESPILQPFQT